MCFEPEDDGGRHIVVLLYNCLPIQVKIDNHSIVVLHCNGGWGDVEEETKYSAQ